MAMDETSCRGRTKHRTSEERTPVGTQSAEGYCRKCDQRDPGRRRDELPEAPQSFLAHFSVLPDERMERDAHPARPASPQYSIPMCLRITFSGSTNQVQQMMNTERVLEVVAVERIFLVVEAKPEEG